MPKGGGNTAHNMKGSKTMIIGKAKLINCAIASSKNEPDKEVYVLINESVGQSTITLNVEVVRSHLAKGFKLYAKCKNGELCL